MEAADAGSAAEIEEPSRRRGALQLAIQKLGKPVGVRSEENGIFILCRKGRVEIELLAQGRGAYRAAPAAFRGEDEMAFAEHRKKRAVDQRLQEGAVPTEDPGEVGR